MTLAQLEERVTALEKAIEEMRLQGTSATNGNGYHRETNRPPVEEDDFIPGVEYDLVVDVPPEEQWHFMGRIVAIDSPPAGLGLSDAEWESLALEDDDE